MAETPTPTHIITMAFDPDLDDAVVSDELAPPYCRPDAQNRTITAAKRELRGGSLASWSF